MSRPTGRSPSVSTAIPLLSLLSLLLLAPRTALHARGGTTGDVSRAEAALPGPLLAAATVELADGSTTLAVLVGPPEAASEDEDGEDTETDPDPPDPEEGSGDRRPGRGDLPRSLLLIDPATGAVTLLADDLPPEARRLAAVGRPDGSGSHSGGELLAVAADDELLLFDPSADPPLRPSRHPLEGTLLTREGLAAEPAGLLATVRPGALELLTTGPDGRLERATRFALPKRAERKRWGVRITSPAVHRVGGEAGETAPACWAVGPERQGERRLRTLLYCDGELGSASAGERAGGGAEEPAGGAAGPSDPVEAWSLLPAAETVTESLFIRFRGRPLLVVLTREKLGLFVKQRLRLYFLEASRNRVGSDPLLAAETDCPLWRSSTLGFADADGDGRDDLYLGCEKGLIDQELRVEVYRYLGGGRFEERARDETLDGDHSSWAYGPDWTGDGLPDLLAVREGRLELHPGTGGRRRPIERRSAATLELPGSPAPDEPGEEDRVEVEVTAGPDGEEKVTLRLGGPEILGTLDLTGDGRHEIVVHRGGHPGGMITILSPR